MKYLLLICSGLLFLAIVELPIGYFTLLRIVVTIGAIAVIINEIDKGFNLWVIVFGIIAILFNPLIPIYFHDKDIWMPIDIITGIIFLIKTFSVSKPQVNK